MLCIGRCYVLADVIAMYCCGRWSTTEVDVITSISSRWQMLLPFFYFVADGNLLLTCGLYIRVSNPSLNRNLGKYHLPHIWDEVLLNVSELKIK